jgi:hypothetical protein
LALMGGAGRQLTPVASSPGKIEALSSPSISPECGFQCRPTVQPLFEKVTARVKAEVPHPVRCIALKAAETDATKRALATFGRPFGLELYRKDKDSLSRGSLATLGALPQRRLGLHPDDTTPIPRPSHWAEDALTLRRPAFDP